MTILGIPPSPVRALREQWATRGRPELTEEELNQLSAQEWASPGTSHSALVAGWCQAGREGCRRMLLYMKRTGIADCVKTL